jgi:deoxycytidylate deaminase
MLVPKRIIDLAVKEAMQSSHTFRLGCIIFKGKKIISKGRNYKLKFTKAKSTYLKWPASIHAELDAIMRARITLKGTNLIVVRINKNGKFLLSRPCPYCLQLIQHYGIKRIIYSNSSYPYLIEERV